MFFFKVSCRYIKKKYPSKENKKMLLKYLYLVYVSLTLLFNIPAADFEEKHVGLIDLLAMLAQSRCRVGGGPPLTGP